MKKTHIYVLIAIIAIFGLIAGIRAIIKYNKKKKEENAWKVYQTAVQELDQGKFGSAMTSCETALPDLTDPAKRGECISLFGEALINDKNIIEGKEKLIEGLELNPKNWRARMALGKLYYEEAKNKPKSIAENLYRDSLKEFNESLKYCKSDDYRNQQDIKFYQGDILEKFKNFGDATQKYIELVEIGEAQSVHKSKFFDEAKRRIEILEKE